MNPADDAIVSEIEIEAAPERVFAALTDPEQLFDWWGAEPSVDLTVFEMDARPGGQWRFECTDRAGHAVNGVTEYAAHGEIVELVPPRLLTYTWIANWHDDPTKPTLVRWELTPAPNGTRVRVTHSGLSGQHVIARDYTTGWPGVLRLLNTFRRSEV